MIGTTPHREETLGEFLALETVRAVAAVGGFAAAAYLMMALLGRALGRIIS